MPIRILLVCKMLIETRFIFSLTHAEKCRMYTRDSMISLEYSFGPLVLSYLYQQLTITTNKTAFKHILE
jgi:hypothetical protein